MRSDVLNPELYELLKRKFGKVEIANHGCPAKVASYSKRNGRTRAEITPGGEYYRVNCPMCPDGDRGFRLWFSHLYGRKDRRVGKLTHLAFCYKCHGKLNDSYVPDILADGFGDFRIATPEEININLPPLEPVQFPDDSVMCRVGFLSETHPVSAYIRRRGFSVQEAHDKFYWMLCESSPEPMLAKRLVMPVLYERPEDDKLILVGWQARAVPGYSVCEEPKYYTMPGFKKGRVLYNLHNARRHDVVVITEGILDAVRVGTSAVALLGSSLSMHQLDLLLEQCSESKIAVLLDSDAFRFAYLIYNMLSGGAMSDRRIKGGVSVIGLKSGDPCDHDRTHLHELIRSAVEKRADGADRGRITSHT